jgi:hypothetical protein
LQGLALQLFLYLAAVGRFAQACPLRDNVGVTLKLSQRGLKEKSCNRKVFIAITVKVRACGEAADARDTCKVAPGKSKDSKATGNHFIDAVISEKYLMPFTLKCHESII